MGSNPVGATSEKPLLCKGFCAFRGVPTYRPGRARGALGHAGGAAVSARASRRRPTARSRATIRANQPNKRSTPFEFAGSAEASIALHAPMAMFEIVVELFIAPRPRGRVGGSAYGNGVPRRPGGVGLLRDSDRVEKVKYAAVGWIGLLGSSVAGMAITKQASDDPAATVVNTITFTPFAAIGSRLQSLPTARNSAGPSRCLDGIEDPAASKRAAFTESRWFSGPSPDLVAHTAFQTAPIPREGGMEGETTRNVER